MEILFVDDDPKILDLVKAYLFRQGLEVTTHHDGLKAIETVKKKNFDIVFSDLMMPSIDGLTLLKAIKQVSPETEVIIVTGYASIESAIEALKLGGYDYLQKPINFERLRILIDRIAEKKRLQKENILIKQRLKERFSYDKIVGKSPKMQELYNIIDRISMGSPTVLIQGESGTGKELVANVIHQNSDRKDKPFIPINCGAISEGLLESELFGHVKGAFTGAVRNSIGLFKAADGGTIFLDEIAEVPPVVQVKLLRVLQEKKIRPVGEYKESEVDVRVIAATNQNLEESIKKNAFREDLFYRLNVIYIKMPPLREIKADLPFLINHFLKKFGRQMGGKELRISSDTLNLLSDYFWPGNVRQLENVIERAYALSSGKVIEPSDLPPEIRNFSGNTQSDDSNLNLRDNEIKLIKKALQRANGNKATAAQLLGINLSTVYRKLDKYGIADI
ncbi:MAG: sigma-54 dependent transcriptional regulator [Desulfobacteraceae bacterium]